MLDRLLRRRKALVGIDIGDQTISAVAVLPDSPMRVTGFGQVSTPPGAVHDGTVLDASLLAEGFRQVLAAAKITARTVALAVPAQYGFLRRVTFPKMPLKELRATIDLQPERYIPLARDESVYDLQILPDKAPDGQMTVVVGAAPRQNVAGLMTACKLAGLKPVRIDLEPLALHRALVGAGLAEASASVAIVGLGSSGAKISLFEGAVPVITRVVAAADSEELFLDIRRSLEFAISQSGARPSRVFVAGGDEFLYLALTGYLRGFLSDRLPRDLSVEPLRAPDLGLPQSQMLAFGLALSPEMFA